MNSAQTYVNICVPEIQDQWKYGYVLVDQGNIFHTVKVVREEEWYLWSAKHCGILWETTYIFSLSENILIFTLAIPALGLANLNLSLAHSPDFEHLQACWKRCFQKEHFAKGKKKIFSLFDHAVVLSRNVKHTQTAFKIRAVLYIVVGGGNHWQYTVLVLAANVCVHTSVKLGLRAIFIWMFKDVCIHRK